MAERDRFTDQEWDALVKGAAGAASAVVATDRPGMVALMKEGYAMGKAVRAARKEDDWPTVVAELIAYQKHHQHDISADLQKDQSTNMDEALAQALDLVSAAAGAARKFTPEEMDGYVEWVIGIARATAEAATESGSDTPVSEQEEQLLTDLESRIRQG